MKSKCCAMIAAVVMGIVIAAQISLYAYIHLNSIDLQTLEEQCATAAFEISAFSSASFRSACWTNTQPAERIKTTNGLTAICAAQGLFSTRSVLWGEYCKQLQTAGIISKPITKPYFQTISAQDASGGITHTELRVIESYLFAFRNILQTNLTTLWPIQHWSQIHTNITRFKAQFMRDTKQLIDNLKESVLQLESMQTHGFQGLEKHQFPGPYWEDLKWQKDNALIQSQLTVTAIENHLSWLSNKTESQLQSLPQLFFPNDTNIPLSHLLPRLYDIIPNHILSKPSARFARPPSNGSAMPQLIHPEKPTGFSTSISAGFYRIHRRRSYTWFAPGAKLHEPRHQANDCMMKTFLGSQTAQSCRPSSQGWRGLVQPRNFATATSVLEELHSSMANVCNTPILSLQKLDIARNATVQDLFSIPSSCTDERASNMFPLFDPSRRLSRSEIFILHTLTPYLREEPCAIMPWKFGHFQNKYYARILICRNDFALRLWPLEGLVVNQTWRYNWHGAQFILIQDDASMVPFHPIPSAEFCPISWEEQSPLCGKALFKAQTSLALLNANYPFQFNSRMDPREPTPTPITELQRPPRTSAPNLHPWVNQNKLHKRAALFVLARLLGFDSDVVGSSLNRAIQYAQMNTQAIIELRNMTNDIVHELNLIKKTHRERSIGSVMHKLLRVLENAIDTQIGWIDREYQIFEAQLADPARRAKLILDASPIHINWENFWTFQFEEFQSSCIRSKLGHYCEIAMKEEHWQGFDAETNCRPLMVQIYRVDITNTGCILLSDIQGIPAQKLHVKGFGATFSIRQIHQMYTADDLVQHPFYVAVSENEATFIDRYLWDRLGKAVIQSHTSWQYPYMHLMFQSNWRIPSGINWPSRLIYASSVMGLSIYTAKARQIPIYSCTTSEPFRLSLEPGVHAINYFQDNNKMCTDQPRGFSRMYVSPAEQELHQPPDSKEIDERVTPTWMLSNPGSWNDTITNVLLAIAVSHIGTLHDPSGRTLQAKFNISWKDISLKNGSIYPDTESSFLGVPQFIKDTGSAILTTLDVTKHAREDLKKLVKYQEQRFNNLTEKLQEDAQSIVSVRTLQWVSQLQQPVAIATTILTAIISILFTCYKVKAARSTRRRLKTIQANTESTVPDWVSLKIKQRLSEYTLRGSFRGESNSITHVLPHLPTQERAIKNGTIPWPPHYGSLPVLNNATLISSRTSQPRVSSF